MTRPTPAAKVHVSYEQWTGHWSTPVCLGSQALAESYTNSVDQHLGGRGKRHWRYLACTCPKR